MKIKFYAYEMVMALREDRALITLERRSKRMWQDNHQVTMAAFQSISQLVRHRRISLFAVEKIHRIKATMELKEWEPKLAWMLRV